MRRIAFFTFVFLFALSAHSEETITLDSLVQFAKANNLEIRAMMQKYLASRQKIIIEKSWEYPEFGITRSSDKSRLPTLPKTNSTPISFSFSQMIPFPGKPYLKGKIAESEAKVYEQELNLKIIEVVAEVKNAFWMYWLTDKLTEIYKENIELMRRFLDIATKQYTLAKTSQVDVLKANTELAQMEIMLAMVEQEEKPKFEAELNVLLNRIATTPLGKPNQPEWKKFNYTSAELETLALKNQPEIKAKKLLSKKSTFAVDLARLEFFPDIMVGMGYTRMKSMRISKPLIPDKFMDGSEFMIQVQLPLYYKKQSSMVKMLEREREMAKLEVQAAKITTVQEVRSLWSAIDSYKRKIQIHEASLLPLARQTVEITEAEYRTGKMDFLDLLDSQKRYLDYNIEYYKNLVERELVFIELEKAVGVELK